MIRRTLKWITNLNLAIQASSLEKQINKNRVNALVVKERRLLNSEILNFQRYHVFKSGRKCRIEKWRAVCVLYGSVYRNIPRFVCVLQDFR